ncbi:MAG: hypothetical protein HYY00_02970 [Chloroflexi bacterium]|nr:hypothetical protein [Chloroflexota bacterium]
MPFRERDFFKERFSEGELRELLGSIPPSQAFAWRSPTARARGLRPSAEGLRPEALSEDDLLRLMLEEPRLVRRPLVRVGDRLLVGANLKALEAFLGSSSP